MRSLLSFLCCYVVLALGFFLSPILSFIFRVYSYYSAWHRRRASWTFLLRCFTAFSYQSHWYTCIPNTHSDTHIPRHTHTINKLNATVKDYKTIARQTGATHLYPECKWCLIYTKRSLLARHNSNISVYRSFSNSSIWVNILLLATLYRWKTEAQKNKLALYSQNCVAEPSSECR